MLVKVVAVLLAFHLTVATDSIVGAPQDADMNNTELQAALSFAVTQHNAQSKGTYISKVVKVIKAQVQVVSGLKYIFHVEMANTSCKKGEPENTCDICLDPDIAQPHECTLAVWSQSWLQLMTLIEDTC